jgi:hypothetical protein
MIISRNGIVLRTPVDSIASQGRATMGVTLMDVDPGDSVASITTIDLSSPPGVEPPAGDGPSPAPAKAKTPARSKPAEGKAATGKPAAGKPAAGRAAAGKPAAGKAAAGKPAAGKAAAGKPATKKTRPSADRKTAGPRTRRARR